MNAETMVMERAEALEKQLACANEGHADSQEFNRRCEQAYSELAEGRKLLHLSKSIQKAGLGDDGRPRLAVAPADRAEVGFYWRRENPIATFFDPKHGRWNTSRYPRLSRYVDMGTMHKERERLGYALLPGIPADVRPKTGMLRDWYVLFEVEKWADTPQSLPAPVDPFLLKHIGGELYSIIAEWNLTPIEQAILEEINRERIR